VVDAEIWGSVRGVELRWHDRSFGELSIVDLYAILELRQRVFVVEQSCAYLDADGLDRASRHLWAEPPAGDDIVAYLRISPAGVKYREVSLGRIATAPRTRGMGLGRELVRRGLAAVGPAPVRISAQAHLERFYAGLGFHRASEPYSEDGIVHIEMLRA
jgi:ElaA protein